jgi:CDP-4-dehydro-6-deoxyglucose reductase, E3
MNTRPSIADRRRSNSARAERRTRCGRRRYITGMAPSERRASVVAARALSPTVRSLSLDVADPSLALRAGQWLNLFVPTPAGLEKRAYSIASAPAERPIEIAVTYVAEGAASPPLHTLPPGAELLWDGPHGFFTRDEPASSAPALFVATGTGVCPLRSMLRELWGAPLRTPITLLFGVRSVADILWREEFEACAARDPNFRLEVTLSRPGPGWSGRVGYVQQHVAELARSLSEPHVFICGLSRMVGDVRALCKSELGYDRKRVHSERYD